MHWSISSLAACKAWRVIRAQVRRWARPPARHGRSEIPKRTDQLTAAGHTFFYDSVGDTRETGCTPCFIKSQVKYRSMWCRCVLESIRQKEKQMLIRQEGKNKSSPWDIIPTKVEVGSKVSDWWKFLLFPHTMQQMDACRHSLFLNNVFFGANISGALL